MDGNYIIGGHTVPINPDGTDGPGGWEGTAIKVNKESKSVMWLKTFGNPNNGPDPSVIFDECYGVVAVPWGGYALSCGSGIEPPYTSQDPFNVWRAYVVRLDTNGNMMWEKTYDLRPTTMQRNTSSPRQTVGLRSSPTRRSSGEFDGGYGLYRIAPEIETQRPAHLSQNKTHTFGPAFLSHINLCTGNVGERPDCIAAVLLDSIWTM